MKTSHDPATNFALVGLGLIGTWVPTAGELQSLYFLLLIGPAAWSCWRWIKDTIWPAAKDILKKKDE